MSESSLGLLFLPSSLETSSFFTSWSFTAVSVLLFQFVDLKEPLETFSVKSPYDSHSFVPLTTCEIYLRIFVGGNMGAGVERLGRVPL